VQIRDIVREIQKLFPPQGQLPAQAWITPTGDAPDAGATLKVPRQPLPAWLETHGAVLLRAGHEIVHEGHLKPGPAPKGPDILAYYLPFHFYKETWGVYLRGGGILSLAAYFLKASRGRVSAKACFTTAQRILLEHERFHFVAEVACSRAELAMRGHLSLYPAYFADGSATATEEALCNARAFRVALRGLRGDIRQVVASWMTSQGPGYRDFARYLGQASFSGGQRDAAGRMVPKVSFGADGLLCRAGSGVTALFSTVGVHVAKLPAPLESLFACIRGVAAPTYVVLDVSGVGVLRPFPKYLGIRVKVHTHDHPPPHIHVEIPPGKLFSKLEWRCLKPLPGQPSLTGQQKKDLARYLEKYGADIEKRTRNTCCHSKASPA
jgi:hypothetical protein